MAVTMKRSRFEELSPAERSRVVAEGCQILDDDHEEREAQRARILEYQAEARRARTISRERFDEMTQPERDAHIAAGGLLSD